MKLTHKDHQHEADTMQCVCVCVCAHTQTHMEMYAYEGTDLTCCAVLVLLLHANVEPEDSLNAVPRVIIWVSSPKMSRELDEPE